MGRTRAGRDDAFDEIYNEDLYISLDGESSRWQIDKKTKKLIKAKKNRDDKHEKPFIDEGKTGLRRALAWWVGNDQMPWLVLSGSPGGGKTVFLTRLAAALAENHLKGHSGLEQKLDFKQLRKAGPLPIPIILEATGLKVEDFDQPANLAKVIYQQLTISDEHVPLQGVLGVS